MTIMVKVRPTTMKRAWSEKILGPREHFVQNCIHLHFLGRNIRLIWYKSSTLKYLGQVCCPKESHNIQPQFWRCIPQNFCLWGPNQAVILEVIPLFPLIWLIFQKNFKPCYDVLAHLLSHVQKTMCLGLLENNCLLRNLIYDPRSLQLEMAVIKVSINNKFT